MSIINNKFPYSNSTRHITLRTTSFTLSKESESATLLARYQLLITEWLSLQMDNEARHREWSCVKDWEQGKDQTNFLLAKIGV